MPHSDTAHPLRHLSPEEITQFAYDSGFQQRQSGKISPVDFFNYFCYESMQGTLSYNDLAAKIQAQTGSDASRQAYHQRMGPACVSFFEKVLSYLMGQKTSYPFLQFPSGKYKRILLQDSTVLRLPERLFESFSGVKNAHKSVCNARVQCVYDLISQEFIKYSIDPFSKNDLAATYDIPAKEGDLIIRDRGYFTVGVMTKLKKQDNAHSIFRYKHKTIFYDPESGQELNLLDYLRLHGSIDKVVLAGKEKQHRLRLVAVPVPEEVANLRRMKAKKESSSKKPSIELRQLMSWSIFVTTIMDPNFTFSFFAALYGLRWRIENIFKTWKSNFNFDRIHNVSKNQLQVLLRARLVMITMSYHFIYRPLSLLVSEGCSKTLSLMKLTRYISRNRDVLWRLLSLEQISKDDINGIIRYCTYDSRKRRNFVDHFTQALNLLEHYAVAA